MIKGIPEQDGYYWFRTYHKKTDGTFVTNPWEIVRVAVIQQRTKQHRMVIAREYRFKIEEIKDTPEEQQPDWIPIIHPDQMQNL